MAKPAVPQPAVPHLAGPPLVLAAPAPSLLPLLLAALGVGAAVLLLPRLARAATLEGAGAFGPAGQPTIPFRPQGAPVPGLGEQLGTALVGTGIRQVVTGIQQLPTVLSRYVADLFRGSPAAAVPTAEILREAPAAVESLVEAGSSAVDAVEAVAGAAGAAAALPGVLGIAGAEAAIAGTPALVGVAAESIAGLTGSELGAAVASGAIGGEAAAAGAGATAAEAAGVGVLGSLGFLAAGVGLVLGIGAISHNQIKKKRAAAAGEIQRAALTIAELATDPALDAQAAAATTLQAYLQALGPILDQAILILSRAGSANVNFLDFLPDAAFQPSLERALGLMTAEERRTYDTFQRALADLAGLTVVQGGFDDGTLARGGTGWVLANGVSARTLLDLYPGLLSTILTTDLYTDYRGSNPMERPLTVDVVFPGARTVTGPLGETPIALGLYPSYGAVGALEFLRPFAANPAAFAPIGEAELRARLEARRARVVVVAREQALSAAASQNSK